MSRVATRPVFTQTGQVAACVSGYHWKSPDVCCFLIWEEEVKQGRGLEGKRQSRGKALTSTCWKVPKGAVRHQSPFVDLAPPLRVPQSPGTELSYPPKVW